MEQSLRKEIAAVAARLIADGGLDYGSAKHKAAREVTGDQRPPRSGLPDNDEIDEALHEHLALFDEHHQERLAAMRGAALELMSDLAAFSPLATGAVWKGLATEHAPIHLQLFHDNVKEVQFHLLNRRIPFEPTAVPHFRHGGDVEAFACLWHDQPVLLSVYGSDDLRGALRPGGSGRQRGDRQALAQLIADADSAPAR